MPSVPTPSTGAVMPPVAPTAAPSSGPNAWLTTSRISGCERKLTVSPRTAPAPSAAIAIDRIPSDPISPPNAICAFVVTRIEVLAAEARKEAGK